jgi:hypothetical protein
LTVSNRHPIQRPVLPALLVCLTLLAGLTGCVRGPVADSDLTTLLPNDPEWLVGLEIQELRSWDRWLELEQQGIHGTASLDRIFEAAGVDPDRDIDRLFGGFRRMEQDTGRLCAIITGRFDPEALAANLEREDFAAESWRDHTLMVTGPEPDIFVVILDETAIGLAETRQGATGMIDRLLDGGESLEDHAGLGPLLARVDRTAPLWTVGLLAADSLSGLASGLPVQGLIPSLSNLAVSVRKEQTLHLSGLTILPGPDEATQLAGQLNGYLKLAGGLIQSNPGWFGGGTDDGDETLRLVAGTIDGTAITAEETIVRMEVDVPKALLDRAARATSPGSPDSPRPGSTPAHP